MKNLRNIAPDKVDKLLIKATDNWYSVTWKGHQLWQNLLDLNVISEFIFSKKPEIIVETGTWKGGSAIFFADIMKLANIKPNVISIDHNPRALPKYKGVKYISFLDSTDPLVINKLKRHLNNKKKVFVILDSDHRGSHVYKELLIYSKFVSKNGYILVQDGNMYKSLNFKFKETPLWGINEFLKVNKNFQPDLKLSPYKTTAHPYGWLKRIK